MPYLTTIQAVQYTVEGEDTLHFQSAMYKICDFLNRPGFDKMGLNKYEINAFNDVVEQMAQHIDQ